MTDGKQSIRILLTSAGRRVELLQCFRAAAADLGVRVEILACDLRPELSAACHLGDRAFVVPPADDPGYADAVLAVCEQQAVQLVVPTIDTELIQLAHARERFAQCGAIIAVSSPALVDIARDKLATASFLTKCGIPSPRSATIEAVRAAPDDWTWPLLVKPRHGSASRGIRLVNSVGELPDPASEEPLLCQERLVGQEFTVNLYFDQAGILRCAISHQRLQVRAGEVEKGRTHRVPALEDIAARLAAELPEPRGVLCFQAMLDQTGQPSMFEINARFGGGYPLAHRAGATFTRWLMEERLGLPASAGDGWREGVVMLRYDAAVFLEP